MANNSFSLNRRCFLGQGAQGVGFYALASLFGKTRAADVKVPRWPGILDGKLHREAKAKRVIFMTMAGGMSHLETFDNKPKLRELDGQPMPDSYTKGQPIAQLQNRELRCLGGQHEFKKHGESGNELSAIWEHLGSVADDIAIVRSLKTEAINHDPAHTFMNTGTTISGRPSMGSWLTYGLGSETENLPGFVVLTSSGGGQDQPIASRQWHSGFLPSRFQGVHFHSQGDPVLYVNNPPGIDREGQGDIVKAVQQLNQFRGNVVNDPEIATRISQYEMAFRMQASVPGLMDTSDETQATMDLYGTKGADGTFAANCLLARRLAERGCRFIQLYHRGWDHHGNVKAASQNTAKLIDQGITALIKDLKQRDMFNDTLIVFASEFGRTPMAQGSGRDHHIKGYSIFLAGGGIKPGTTVGATDDLGYNAAEDVVTVHDLHATMLHLLGIDHERMTFQFQGRDFRLTDVHGSPVDKLLA
ncbi:MAG: sulfatase [Planctomycetaceae bacterium]|nr:sulfatase [Planctomycetaceae bacterium]|tara:strand:- start:1284 stop:2702 length:1419 start_codon:yes stop_codon:yes gene_type:complete